MKKKIAVFTTGWCSEILSQFLTGMTQVFEGKTVDIFLFLCYPIYIDTPAVKQGELNIFNLPDMKDFDGAVIFGSGLNFHNTIDDLVERAKQAGIPVMIQGARHEDAYYVGSDNYVATRDMCKHLVEEHGVKDIIFLAGTVDSMDSEIRLQAVKDFLAERGRSEDLKEVFYTKWENAAVTQYINEFCVSGKELPDAIICANDGLAMEACMSLDRNGIMVPDEVIVTGYDYIEDGMVFDPSIASVDQCFNAMGRTAAELWLDITGGTERENEVVIPCQFIPGDSCGCKEYRNSDKLRRRIGREAFSKRAMTTYFNRKLNFIDSTVLSCLTYDDFKKKLHNLLTKDHDYEGDSFHLLLEPDFGRSIYNREIKLRTSYYSEQMEVVYSTEDGVEYTKERFASKKLVPGYKADGENHLYIFLPLHEADEAYGYIVFRDCMEKVENHFLQTYQSRMGLVFDKFRHSISLDILNQRLIEIMRRDALTKVNNRTAYEQEERVLQEKIVSEDNLEFAIAMFDVNNLKLINDSRGHEAGDAYLVRASRLICNTFKHCPVYRMGGDEFLAVLMGEDYRFMDILIEHLMSQLSPYTDHLPVPLDYISIACGVAIYEKDKDQTVQDVVKRADDIMYQNKADIKAHKTI